MASDIARACIAGMAPPARLASISPAMPHMGQVSAEHPALAQEMDDLVGEHFRIVLARGKGQLRIERRLVGRVDAGEIVQIAAPRLAVEALGVALLANVERRVDEDLDELALLQDVARHLPLSAERRDEGDDGNEPRIDEQL